MTAAKLLDAAFRLAELGRGRVEPNPRVGALALAGGRVIGRGHHADYGGPHAEVAALDDASRGALRPEELVVTLEPCSTQGKTPPCVDAIVRAGVKRVVVGAVDPNPAHRGRGLESLRAAGIEVVSAGEDARFAAQNRPFLRAIGRTRPWVIAKWAMTIDGRTALSSGDSRWVSGEESRTFVHKLRGRCEAVAVGVRTVLRDDPLLTCRAFQALARPPARVIFDSRLRTPVGALVVANHEAPTWILTTAEAPAGARRALERAGAEVIDVLADPASGRVDAAVALDVLAQRGVRRLLCEAGPELTGALRAAGAIDQVVAIVAPKIAGGPAAGAAGEPEAERMAQAAILRETYVERLGDDLLLGGFLL